MCHICRSFNNCSINIKANQIGDHSQKLCEPDQVYREYCNTCVCEAEGCGAICSQNWCPPGMFKENGMLNVTYDFVIDKSKGNLTEIAVVCEPHKFFAYYCNTCVCNANGTRSICSNKRCAKNYNIDGSINSNYNRNIFHYNDFWSGYRNWELMSFSFVSEDPRICRPYSDYIRDCNQCYCSHDGMHAMCTRDKCGEYNRYVVATLNELFKGMYVHLGGSKKG